MVNFQLAKPIIRLKKAFHIIKYLHRADIDPTSALISGQHWNADIKMAYSALLYQSRMECQSGIGMRKSIVQITELHQIHISPTSAAISGQHRDADIEIISKWHIHIGFTDVEIRYLSGIKWPCFGNRIPSHFCRFNIGCYIGLIFSVVDSKTMQNGIFIWDLPIQMCYIYVWCRVVNGIASYLYILISTFISVQHSDVFIKTISKWCFS